MPLPSVQNRENTLKKFIRLCCISRKIIIGIWAWKKQQEQFSCIPATSAPCLKRKPASPFCNTCMKSVWTTPVVCWWRIPICPLNKSQSSRDTIPLPIFTGFFGISLAWVQISGDLGNDVKTHYSDSEICYLSEVLRTTRTRITFASVIFTALPFQHRDPPSTSKAAAAQID